MNLENKILDFIEEHKWTFARSMPWNPHWYLVRERINNDEMFSAFVIYIRLYGKEVKYGKRIFTCLDIGEYYYWTMGNPVDETTIINRSKIKIK